MGGGILQISPASALFDFLKKLIKTVPSSWLKQLYSSQKPLQMTLNVKKIILSISVWPVHLQTGITQGNIHEHQGEQFRNSSTWPFSIATFTQMWGWGEHMLERPPACSPKSMRNTSSNQESYALATVCHQHHFCLFLESLYFVVVFPK